MTPREVLAMCRQKDIKTVDLRYTDLLGALHHFYLPASTLSEDLFEEGQQVRMGNCGGWIGTAPAEAQLIPEAHSAQVDPLPDVKTLALTCNLVDLASGEPDPRDPRAVTNRAAAYLQSTGVAEQANLRPTVEFALFDHVEFQQRNDGIDYRLVGFGQAARDPQRGDNASMPLRLLQAMSDSGLDVRGQHWTESSPAKAAIELNSADIVAVADAVATYKYVVKQLAARCGKFATFMPHPVPTVRTRMPISIALEQAGRSLFAGTKVAGLSETALHGIGGMLKHAPALSALLKPTTNSYVVSSQQSAMRVAYSDTGNDVLCRIPASGSAPKSKRIEFGDTDAYANPYLAMAAILMAAIDGIQNKIDPGTVDRGEPQPAGRFPSSQPSSLDQALDCLDRDRGFLTRGDVLSDELLDNYIGWKRQHEIDQLRRQPHPLEFGLYF